MKKIIENYKHFPITYTIIVVNVIVFIITQKFYHTLTVGQFFNFYISGSKTLNIHEIFSIILSGFTHFSFLHIFFNMSFLYYIGPAVEGLIMRRYYILLYFGTLLLSGIVVIYFSSPFTITIGASGALFGLLGFLIVFYFFNKNQLKHFLNIEGIIFIVVINLIFTFSGKNISAIGHISGLISGAFLGCIIDYLQKIHSKNIRR